MARSREHMVLHFHSRVGELAGELVTRGAHVVMLGVHHQGAGEAFEVVTAGEGEAIAECLA